jgi:hypothetical protein
MSKWKRLKKALKNPPAERLASIEYKSHALNILGILVVTILLILHGFWYIIFAFIFGAGVSYSQMMSSYAKYKAIKRFNPMNLPKIDKDPSPSRRRHRIIQETLGRKTQWALGFALALSIYLAMLPTTRAMAFAYFGIFFVSWLVLYFFPTYWIASYMYKAKRRLKKDGRKEKDKKRTHS